MNVFKTERRQETKKFSSALFPVLLSFIGPLYRCINCIGKTLLKILLVPVRFHAVCFRRLRSAFSRSAVSGLCFPDALQKHFAMWVWTKRGVGHGLPYGLPVVGCKPV